MSRLISQGEGGGGSCECGAATAACRATCPVACSGACQACFSQQPRCYLWVLCSLRKEKCGSNFIVLKVSHVEKRSSEAKRSRSSLGNAGSLAPLASLLPLRVRNGNLRKMLGFALGSVVAITPDCVLKRVKSRQQPRRRLSSGGSWRGLDDHTHGISWLMLRALQASVACGRKRGLLSCPSRRFPECLLGLAAIYAICAWQVASIAAGSFKFDF